MLTSRELDVLRLAAEGYDNEAIARSLVLSVRTVERHLHNLDAKLDISGKSAGTAAVGRLLTAAVGLAAVRSALITRGGRAPLG